MASNFLNAPRTVVRSILILEGKVDDLQPLLFSVVHRIGRPAVLFGEIADTHAMAGVRRLSFIYLVRHKFVCAQTITIIYCIVDISQQQAIKFIFFCGYNLTRGGEVMDETEKWLLVIGQRITERRKKFGWTQEELAERGNLTPQFISYAESGKRAMRPENLLKISSALGVSADYLLTGEVIDKDLLLLSDKLQKLSASQLRIIENIVDECNTLFNEEQNK